MRLILAALAIILMAGACAPSLTVGMRTLKQPGAGETPHIERLVVWLAGDGANFDKANLERAFKERLGPRGIEVSVGENPAYQFGLNDAERSLVARFAATHRLDVKVVAMEEAASASPSATDVLRDGVVQSAVIAAASQAMRGNTRTTLLALYAGLETKPIWEATLTATGRIGGTSQAATEFVNVLMATWEKARVF